VVAHHLKKYEFARQRVQGLVVDVACGVGYGTSHLADAADMAVGLEVAAEAIDVARTRYRHGDTWFVRANAERLPLPDRSADAIVCFEGIEHFVNPEQHLDEVMRVLRPGGRYFVSTPNPVTNAHGHDNPFHLHEFEVSRMESMLSSRFETVEMLGQFRIQTRAHRATQRLDVLGIRKWRIVRPITRLVSRGVLKTAPTEEASIDDFSIQAFSPEALEYVAICTNWK